MNIRLTADLNDYPPFDPVFQETLRCNGCQLSPLRAGSCATKVVPPVGNIRKAKILICLQSPGETEDHYGVPVCGPYHSYLKAIAMVMGFKELTTEFWDKIVVTNALWCHPEGNRQAQSRELGACSHNMNILMKHMDVRLVVACGHDALVLFEGQKSELRYRVNTPGSARWRDPATGEVLREFRVYPVYHPARKDKIQNEMGKVRAQHEEDVNLRWIAEAAKMIYSGCDSLTDPGYIYNFCETETEALGRAEELRDSKPYHLGLDFETWRLYVRKEPIGLAISKAPLEAVYFPIMQTLSLPKEKWFWDKSKTNVPIQIKHGYSSYFSASYPKKLMEIFRPLIEGENRPFITAQHAQIEMSCFDTYGIKLLPRPEQLRADPEIPCFDLLPLARIALQTNKVNLETILQVAMPLEWTMKERIDGLMSKNEKKTTGFGMYSIKPPGLLRELAPPQDKKTSWWCFEMHEPKIKILAERAMLDADWERRLSYILMEMAFGEFLTVNIDPELLFSRQRDDT